MILDNLCRARAFRKAVGITVLSILLLAGGAGAQQGLVAEYHFDGDTINGKLDGSISKTGSIETNTNPLYIGKRGIKDFTFAHMTDVHIGYFPFINYSYMYYSVNNFTDTLQAVKRINPDFIIITGDIVEYDNKDFFIAFKNLLKGIGIPVKGITPGNHDRRNAFYGLLGDNISNYTKYIKPISNPTTIDNNYSFDYKGYRFIGLDSGADYSASILGAARENMTISLECPAFLCDYTPESNGLSSEQMARLRGEFNNSAPKIVFMHHPVMNFINDSSPPYPKVPHDGAPGGNNGAIAFNRWNFTNYTRDSNVQLVLSGHSHYDAVFNLYGKQDKNSSVNRPLFIQTRSSTKSEGPFQKGFRFVEIKDGKANPYNSFVTRRFDRISFSVQFPLTGWYALHAYDAEGRHTGMNAGCTDIEIGIPDSYYTGDYSGFTSTPQVMVSYTGIKKINFTRCQPKSAINDQKVSINLTIEYQTQNSSVIVSLNDINITTNSPVEISNMIGTIQ